jgi:cell division septation protein DedD
MMYRALLVFLVVINLGVAAWWALRSPAQREDRVALPEGVPRLQLLQEAPARMRAAARAASASTLARATTANVPTQCVSFGPYANPALLRRAHERLQPQVFVARVRDVPVGTPRGWRVFVPPLRTHDEAQALVDKMIAAGIDDLLVMPTGPDRNGVALGRFGNEDAARRRQAQLQAAGFSAQVAPIGNVATEGWIDVGAVATFDLARAAQDAAAPQTRPLDCATLR